MGIRFPHAEVVYKNCYGRLKETDEHTEWKGYEKKKDAKLKSKGNFGVDRRTMWFVVETKEEQEILSLCYPDRICSKQIHCHHHHPDFTPVVI